jgi:outer membrane protein OmpA-like peptidoglycan-associated protein
MRIKLHITRIVLILLAFSFFGFAQTDALPGVGGVDAATRLGNLKLKAGLDQTGYQSSAPKGLAGELTTWDSRVYLGMGLGPYFDVSMGQAFYYEGFSDSVASGFGYGDFSFRFKGGLPLAGDPSLVDFAVVLGIDIPVANLNDGLVIRNGVFMDSAEATGAYGYEGLVINGRAVLSVDLSEAEIPLKLNLVQSFVGPARQNAVVGQHLLGQKALLAFDIKSMGGIYTLWQRDEIIKGSLKSIPAQQSFGGGFYFSGGGPLHFDFSVKKALGTSASFGLSRKGYEYQQALQPDLLFGLNIFWSGYIIVPDSDKDGIPDYDDRCPREPEDFDGFEDKDGCPDIDNDEDGVTDEFDLCPDLAEDKDGFKDDDGCSDPDNDGDGICDPWVAEQGLLQQYSSVCRGSDKCPNEAEDIDGFEDEDGCPDPDNDGDGILDRNDLCPMESEDKDGFKDDDGCPDPDNDGDGYCDPWVTELGVLGRFQTKCKGVDKCPEQAENFNGYQDFDGCPDQNPAEQVWLNLEPLQVPITDGVLKNVRFELESAELKAGSEEALINLARQMRWEERTRVELRGHTDNSRGMAESLKLSQEQAQSVLKFLISKGVPANRLKAIGVGSQYPIASNREVSGRFQNRRVEIKVYRF